MQGLTSGNCRADFAESPATWSTIHQQHWLDSITGQAVSLIRDAGPPRRISVRSSVFTGILVAAHHTMTLQNNAAPPFVNTLPASEGHPIPSLPKTDEGIRVCQVIGLKPEALEEYKRVHEDVFEGVLKALRRAGVVGKLRVVPGARVGCSLIGQLKDYSIHHFELPLNPSSTTTSSASTPSTTHILVAHMRYINSTSLDDFKRDMAKIGEDPETQRWWQVSIVCSRVTQEGNSRV